MSIAVLTQVYDEVRRLAIAGSVVAGDDFRLKKLVAPLRQAGAKAPVFAKVADAAKTLVDSDERSSAAALLELSSLVNAILYTQGETGAAGELAPLATTDVGLRTTQTPARMLKPLLEALQETGAGRLEIIRDALAQNLFGDLRLVDASLRALDDPYPEIAELVAEKILPQYGPAIFGLLQARYNPPDKAEGEKAEGGKSGGGKAGDARRLKLMHRLDASAARPLVEQALADGAKELKIAAIECLGGEPEDLSFLLEQSKAKAKDVRRAAYVSLARLDAPEAIETLKQAIAGPDAAMAVEAVRRSNDLSLVASIVGEAERTLAEIMQAKKAEEAAKHGNRLQELLAGLEGRRDAVTEAFLLDLFRRREKLAKSKLGRDEWLDAFVCRLLGNGSPVTRRALVAARDSLYGDGMEQAILAAREMLSPAELFEMFSPCLTAKVDEKKKDRDPAWRRRADVAKAIYFCSSDMLDGPAAPQVWDPRWLDLAVQINDMDLVRMLARPGHAPVLRYLSDAIVAIGKSKGGSQSYEVLEIVETMVRVEHPDATDHLIAWIEKQNKKNAVWTIERAAPLVARLPKSAIEPLERLLPKLEDRAGGLLAEYVTELKRKP